MTPTIAAPTDLAGKTCIVTGAAGGVGSSVVEHFPALHATIRATDIGKFTNHAELAGKNGVAFERQPFNLPEAACLRACCDQIDATGGDALLAEDESRHIGEKKRMVREEVPMGYMGSPSDVARVAVFLTGDQSGYITAQTLCVNGGNVLR